MFTRILEFDVFNRSKLEFLNYIDKFSKVNIVSGNPEILYNGLNDSRLLKSFTSKSTVIIPDGLGTVLASRIVRPPVKEKIAGIEVMEALIEKCSEERNPIYLLGARQNILEDCIKNLKSKYPNLNIAGSHNGYFNLDECEDIIQNIKESGAHILFVAMGAPRQDIFIVENMDRLPCRVYMGVGGSFDVFSGKTKRAPAWMIKSGLEWLYRVFKEPWRIKRLSSIPKFLLKVIVYSKKFN
ncbi:WecB/TagA/CpsF family glycosyltransferase [Clostridium kluyveri]|uniref:N-acetylglucosaminyldiphosphoundecaprenol N-acetyl-beta-D-mannosaminyltransferase n=1 Tax=Clostridium kluyveri TaxID=1534 RepID=A0A1L5FBQ6_CLOKL|nr:WecB/TagA/CpsF family glycosyltransferase [Clostridium kluyveri]APM40403.1 glycosyltransferase [Clostridium kluyveri]UZQ49344.1 WecB/TagA/CpsF family glycosyltransferase [Clostridium kluyveri]